MELLLWFYPNYAMSISSFLEILKKNVKWQWSPAHQRTFGQTQANFLRSFTISHPNFSETLYLQTDSSENGLGAIVYQIDASGKHQIVSPISRILRGLRHNYTTTEKEIACIHMVTIKALHFVKGAGCIDIQVQLRLLSN